MISKWMLAGATLGLAISFPAYAQQGSEPASKASEEYRLPYQKEFWGYVGATAGRADYDLACVGGLPCDDRDTGYKLYGGGTIKGIFGFELGYVDLGKAEIAGGDMRARGVNASLLLNAPIGQASGLHAKVGTTYGWTRVNSVVPGFTAGKEKDFGLSYGLGATIGLTKNWQARLDWDRYRFDFTSGDRDIDMYSAGLQYRF